MKTNGVPEKVAMDKSGTNKAAMDEINARGESQIVIRSARYLNNTRGTRPPRDQTCHQADAELQVISDSRSVLTGIELMPMIRKGQLMLEGCIKLSFADQFYALAGKIRPV